MSIAAFLDESRRKAHHPVLAVGGFVCDLGDVPAIEQGWRIPRLGAELKCIVALLEDFRPESFATTKKLRKDMYVQRRAFDYVLQRLASRLFLPVDTPGPHLVFLDRHDDFGCYDEREKRAVGG